MSEKNQNENTSTTQLNNTINTSRNHPSKIFSFFAFSEKLASLEYLRWLIIALMPVLILLRYTVDRVDNDLWWQMAHGRYYITHHTLTMDLTIFSWTPTDPTWIYNTWLGSIVVYLFYNFMGGFGLWLFQWFIFLGIFLSFYFFLRLVRQQYDITSITLIAAIGIACSIACCYYKPELFSCLLFSWTVFIFFCVKITHKKFLFYFYPLIFFFWVNLHGAFLMGLVFLVMASIGEALNRIFFPRESFTLEELAHFGIALVLSMAATILNPYGIDYLLSLMQIITNAIGYNSGPYDKLVFAYSGLWIFLKQMNVFFFTGGLTVWIMTLMIFSIFSLIVYELIKKRICDFTLLIVTFALYWKGMEQSRTCYFFPITFFFVFFYILIYRLKLRSIPARATMFSLLVFIFFFVSISYFNLRYGADNKWFGTGLDDYAPVQEVAFLKKYRLEGPIFNDYLIGGYLIWDLYPDYKIFIDPRGGLYNKQFFSDYMEFTMKPATRENILRLTKKYPFKIAIISYVQLDLILSFMKTNGEWGLLYFEKNAAILVHKSLLPSFKSKVSHVNLNPSRFSKVINPEILRDVFNIYIQFDPKAARYIYNIYKRNIKDYYGPKSDILQSMDINIRLKEQQLQNKAS